MCPCNHDSMYNTIQQESPFSIAPSMKEPKMGKAFRYLRKDVARQSQKEFAAALGVTQEMISYIENDSSYASPKVIARLKEMYPGLNENWISGRSTDMFVKEADQPRTLSPQEVVRAADTIAFQQQQIDELREQVAQLREDKEFLRSLLKSKGVK